MEQSSDKCFPISSPSASEITPRSYALFQCELARLERAIGSVESFERKIRHVDYERRRDRPRERREPDSWWPGFCPRLRRPVVRASCAKRFYAACRLLRGQ